MIQKEFQENWQKFSDLVDSLNKTGDESMNNHIKQYVEQNMMILNDVFTASIDNLKRLQSAKTTNDVICTQARFANEVSKKLSLSTQRFLNASLGNIADYNDWLKAHCDLATD